MARVNLPYGIDDFAKDAAFRGKTCLIRLAEKKADWYDPTVMMEEECLSPKRTAKGSV